MQSSLFDRTIGGNRVSLFTLTNRNGMNCLITNYGGCVVALTAPDKHGRFEDVVLGYPDLQGYLSDGDTYFGATVGRVANRTAGARFSLGGREYRLSANDGPNHLHGGPKGFHAQVWEAEQVSDSTLLLRLHDADGAEGYPGNLNVQVTYTLTADNALHIDYRATTDQPTPLNLTNHSYFNLKGAGHGTIEAHVLHTSSSHYLPVDHQFIPTGEMAATAGTPFDFRNPARLSERLAMPHPQLGFAKGFDHHYVPDGDGLRSFATMWEPLSGRTLEVLSDAPGFQFYSGNFLDGSATGKNGLPYPFRAGFCFEAQHFPNSVNESRFPNIILLPEKTYASKCIYKFGVK